MALDQRSRILDAAVGLMARRGTRGMSMRGLAAACDCNVATLYHYFPSKRDLVAAVVAHGRYEALLSDPFPEGVAGTPEERLAALLGRLFEQMMDEDDLWRVLLAEALRADDEILGPVLGMSAAFEDALTQWVARLLPDLPALSEPPVVRTLRHAMYGVLLEHLPQPEGRDAVLAERAREIATVFARLAVAGTASPPDRAIPLSTHDREDAP